MNIKKCRRILSLLLCVMLILSSMSIPVFAEEAGGAPCAHGNTVAREEAGEAASCTAEGSHTVITECADCGEELSRESVTDKALGHDYRETARMKASYNAEGSVTYTCSRCGDGFTDILPMLQNEDGQADGQQAETGSGEQSDVTQPVDEQDEEGSVLRNDVRAGDEISPWVELQSTLDNVSEVVLMDDYTAGADDAALVIPADSTVILDLNGHTLNRNLTSEEENGSVIINNGSLTITGEGKITGGYSSGSGGAIINHGTLTISGGRKLGTVLLFLSPCFMETGGQKQKDRPLNISLRCSGQQRSS